MAIDYATAQASAKEIVHEQLYCALAWGDERAVPEDLEQANAQLAATTRFWRK